MLHKLQVAASKFLGSEVCNYMFIFIIKPMLTSLSRAIGSESVNKSSNTLFKRILGKNKRVEFKGKI